MSHVVFDSNPSGQMNVVLSPEEDAILQEIFSDPATARRHPAVQSVVQSVVQNPDTNVHSTLNAWTVFSMIWRNARRSGFHSSKDVYRARRAYLVNGGALAAIVEELNSYRKRAKKETRGKQSNAQGKSRTPNLMHSEPPIAGPSSSLSYPVTFSDTSAVTTMPTYQFHDVLPAQYYVRSSSNTLVDPPAFASDFASVPSTFFPPNLTSSHYPSYYPPPGSYATPRSDLASDEVWGGNYRLSQSHSHSSPGTINPYDMHLNTPRGYSGSQLTNAGPSYHASSAPTPYPHGLGGDHGALVQPYNGLYQTGHDPRAQQNQGGYYYEDTQRASYTRSR